ncbi:YggT family protein [Serpentinicella sp. ANB-PHB4]|uniref:YggT family protein n=1 Tax=Serpentinicella sp. ANB-PHB4 TaxID=3074076 RepID=UPI0028544FBC|nr:YggT family protein [Serpentinicella sp. ANB-PHB4]MDR5657923.1 YggT family protein [Serpentinicella sp. ANB-PHB4]
MPNASTVRLALMQLSRVIEFLILVRVLLSWVRPNPYNPIVQFIHTTTEPILAPVRKLIYGLGYNGMIDFSPIISLFLVRFIFNQILQFI